MEFHCITIYVHCYGLFKLAESKSETNTDSLKFYYQWSLSL